MRDVLRVWPFIIDSTNPKTLSTTYHQCHECFLVLCPTLLSTGRIAHPKRGHVLPSDTKGLASCFDESIFANTGTGVVRYMCVCHWLVVNLP